MRPLTAIAVFFLMILFYSCASSSPVIASQKSMMDAWIGRSRAELLKSWGRPAKETPDGNGGEVITYDTTISHPQSQGAIYNNGNRGLSNYAADNYVVTRSRIFYINSHAVVYRWDSAERQGY